MSISSPFAQRSGTLSMSVVYCRGCGVELGITPVSVRMYCDELCLTEFPGVNANEFRDSILSAVFAKNPGIPKVELARSFDIARQRVDQILSLRDYS